MSRYQTYKKVILEARPCADGVSVKTCPSCLADRIARLDANLCWYCRNARITQSLTLKFPQGGTLVHLVCFQCAEAMNGELVAFEKGQDRI